MEQQHMTTAAVARRLGVTPSGVLKLVKRERIKPAAKLDGLRGHYFFDPAEVERVVKERQR